MLAVVEYSLVIRRPGQSRPPGKTRRAGTQGNGSDRQTSPALGASGIDDATTILGCHAGTEAVGPLTLQITGLIGSFHDSLHPVPGSAACCWQTRKGAKITVFHGDLSIPSAINGLPAPNRPAGYPFGPPVKAGRPYLSGLFIRHLDEVTIR